MILRDAETSDTYDIDPANIVQAQRALSGANALYDVVGHGRIVATYSKDVFDQITADMWMSDQLKDGTQHRWLRPELMTRRVQRIDRVLYFTDDSIRVEMFDDVFRSVDSKIAECVALCPTFPVVDPDQLGLPL